MSAVAKNTLTQTQFVRSIGERRIAVNDPSLGKTQQAAAKQADLDGDGFVRGRAELAKLWKTGVDKHDRDGNPQTIQTVDWKGRPSAASTEAERFRRAAKGPSTEKASSTSKVGVTPSDQQVVDHMKKTRAAMDAKWPDRAKMPVWAQRMRHALGVMIDDPSARRGAAGTSLNQQQVRGAVTARAGILQRGQAASPAERALVTDGAKGMKEFGSSFFADYKQYLKWNPGSDALDYLKHQNNAMQSGLNELNHQVQHKWVGYGTPGGWTMNNKMIELQNDPRSIWYGFGGGDPGR